MKALFGNKILTPSSQKQRPPRVPKENQDPNSTPSDSSPHRSPGIAGKLFSGKNRSPLPPRPPLKRKLSPETLDSGTPICTASDSGVQVIVRIRPPSKEEEEEDLVVQKISNDSISILDHNFTFDSVADTGSAQEDVFQLVGLPLVENCLAGFNSSIFAYGQTGSGKTYTMWGPPSALSEESSFSNEKGLTPRVFERLFSRINEEQAKHSDKELIFQCSCSFLEIYNEQITDLLDPTQRNLQIREDVGTGVYVESLTEEYVCTMKDVTQLLLKGLANRRTGATSVNSESSRSHCVFTCVIRSQFKNVEDGMNGSRISRINLVDLAGSERQKLTKAAGDRLKEAGNINRSLSQLGNLINILAEISQTGKQRHIPYRDSRLTFLLQESLGGNAKLAMICAVSPSQSCKNETLSTLRFAQRAKAIKNKAVVNEIRQDDVNALREQIRQLKDELLRMKSNTGNSESGSSYSTGWNARRSLNLLRMSLGRPNAPLPPIKDSDSDEEMEIDENDVEKPHTSQESLPSSYSSNENDVEKVTKQKDMDTCPKSSASPSILSIVPTPADSLFIESQARKSPKTPSSLSPSHKAVQENSASDLLFPEPGRTDKLVASLHQGLQVFGNPKNRRASFSFFSRDTNSEALAMTVPVLKVDVGTQTLLEELEVKMEDSSINALNTLNACLNEDEKTSGDGGAGLEIVPEPTDKLKNPQVLKAVEKVLAGAIRREMQLEEHCAKQTAEIQQLNRLVQQYKHERECNAVIAQTREDKISRLESLMDGVLPTEEFMEEEFLSLATEHRHLQKKYENHPEVLRVNIELKRVQQELEQYRNFFDLGERDVLLEEIQDLRNQLNYHMSSPFKTKALGMTHAVDLTVDTGLLGTIEEREEEEKSRASWTEIEGKWITLTDELRVELQSSRSLADRLKIELDSEKQCKEELKEALQTAMQGHARILEQYAELQEKHMGLLARHRKISEGIEDVKRAAAKAGVSRAESKFINSLAAEISVLRAEREKERRYWRDENKGLQAQLRDTAEAVQAAGELLVRLKEAEETAALAQKRASQAEHETEKVYQEMDALKNNYEREILLRDQFLAESRLPKDAIPPTSEPQPEPDNSPADVAKYDASDSLTDQRWRDEFGPFLNGGSGEVSKATNPNSWFFGYDRCNI